MTSRFESRVVKAEQQSGCSLPQAAGEPEAPLDWATRIGQSALGIAKLDPWQSELLVSTLKRICVLTTRQAGKTATCALLAAHIASQGGLALIFSPTQRQSGIMHRRVHECLLADGQTLTAESA